MQEGQVTSAECSTLPLRETENLLWDGVCNSSREMVVFVVSGEVDREKNFHHGFFVWSAFTVILDSRWRRWSKEEMEVVKWFKAMECEGIQTITRIATSDREGDRRVIGGNTFKFERPAAMYNDERVMKAGRREWIYRTVRCWVERENNKCGENGLKRILARKERQLVELRV